jgi:UDP-N-acetylmuramate dehydrogenase
MSEVALPSARSSRSAETAAFRPSAAPSLSSCTSDRMSTYRTRHHFRHFAEFTTAEEFVSLSERARALGLSVYILGNGSNTLFTRSRVRTAVLKNSLAPRIRDLGDGRVEVSSSVPIMKVLRHCSARNLDCFYFLASVPATIGGAIAMNAGLGGGGTIFDYVESVTSVESGRITTRRRDEIETAHRRTMFTGVHDKLITSVVFRFAPATHESCPIRERIDWARRHQDLSVPNCGSVFREHHAPITRLFRSLPPWGLRWPLLRAQFSRKVNNWISCRSRSSRSVVVLIRLVQLAHFVCGRRARTEVIEVG